MTITRRTFVGSMSLAALGAVGGARAQGPTGTLFQNVRVFDGTSGVLSAPISVLVRGNVIASIGAQDRASMVGVVVVEGGNRTLMPGLIDAHAHTTAATTPVFQILNSDPNYMILRHAKAVGELLLQGFTSVRDVGGNSFGLKRAIDEGQVIGPRIWPSGAGISQTSGHGDWRSKIELPRGPAGPLSFAERTMGSMIADGIPEVQRRVREQLMLGAALIKLMAGGGVASDSDPLDVTQYSDGELRAAVEDVENWGTYVAVHAYTPRAIQRAINAGVKCIEHGQLADDASAKLMAERNVWWCLQPFLDDEDAIPYAEGSANRQKQIQLLKGTENAYALAKKYNVKTAFGTDTLFDPKLASRQGAQLAKLVRWYSPAEALRMATAVNGELLALSGLRNPYPGKLGVVQQGALADLLLVEGNPLANIKLIEDPAKNFVVIMKDGKFYKNTLAK